MKGIIKIYICFVVSLLVFSFTRATDNLQAQTKDQKIVNEVLLAMPCQTSEELSNQMEKLAQTAPRSVEILAKMLRPAYESQNNRLEYALNALVNYVSLKKNSTYKNSVKDGFRTAITYNKDITSKAFLMKQLSMIANQEDIPVFLAYVRRPKLASSAINGILRIPGSEGVIMDLIQNDAIDRGLLSYAAAFKRMKQAEPYLLKWYKTAGKERRKEICSALTQCGTKRSLKVLLDNSERKYAQLLFKLYNEGEIKAVLKGAKILRASSKQNIRCMGAQLYIDIKKEDATPFILKSMKDPSRVYRNAILNEAIKVYSNEEIRNLFVLIMVRYKTISADAQVDILNWFGNNHIETSIRFVINQMKNHNSKVANAAINTAAKIGGKAACGALIEQLSGEHSKKSYDALLAFNGDISSQVAITLPLTKDEQTRKALLSLASERRITEVAPVIYMLTGSANEEISNEAIEALSGVATPKDSKKIGEMLDVVPVANIKAVQKALISAVHILEPGKQYLVISSLMKNAKNISRFYPVLASTGENAAVKDLVRSYNNSQEEALEGLLLIDNYKAAPALLKIVKSKQNLSEKILPRFIFLVSKYEKNTENKFSAYDSAMKLATTALVQRIILNKLGMVPSVKALKLAGKYLDNEFTAHAAANAVSEIAPKILKNISRKDLKIILEKAIKVYSHSASIEDGCAKDKLSKILASSK